MKTEVQTLNDKLTAAVHELAQSKASMTDLESTLEIAKQEKLQLWNELLLVKKRLEDERKTNENSKTEVQTLNDKLTAALQELAHCKASNKDLKSTLET